MNVKQRRSETWLSIKINLSTTISMKRSRREFLIDMVIDKGILKNDQIPASFAFIPYRYETTKNRG